jgi:hypothetical protein
MSKEDKLKEYVRNTYDELHAPEGLRRKVMNMNEFDTKKMGMSVVKKLAVAAAIAAVLFAGSNGVAYAMTGSTWVETMMARINVNGVWQDVELEGEVLEDGTIQYSTTLDVQEEEPVGMVIVTDSVPPEYVEIYTDTTVEPERKEIVVEDGIIYLMDGDVKIDITEDMEDGIATGSYEKNSMVYQYEVKEEPGVPGCYELHISSEE